MRVLNNESSDSEYLFSTYYAPFLVPRFTGGEREAPRLDDVIRIPPLSSRATSPSHSELLPERAATQGPRKTPTAGFFWVGSRATSAPPRNSAAVCCSSAGWWCGMGHAAEGVETHNVPLTPPSLGSCHPGTSCGLTHFSQEDTGAPGSCPSQEVER